MNRVAAIVEMKVARIAAPVIPEGFGEPYWLRKAITVTGINCREEIFSTRNAHISVEADFSLFPRRFSFLFFPADRFLCFTP